MKVKISELRSLVNKALKYYGYSPKEVKQISKVLLYAQLRGNNQGIVKLVGNGLPKNPKAGNIKVIKRTKLSALINGNRNMGMVVVNMATDMVIKIAGEYGFGIVGTNNTSSSTGAIGYYANQIANKGLIGLVFAGSPETVTTHGSYEPLFGTNPLAIGIPSKKDPIVLDMATSAMAYYGLIEANVAGRKIPSNVAYDDKGKLTTDPKKAMSGSILPFDRNYKGAGLSLIVEILTGPLVAAGFTGFKSSTDWGNLVIAIKPNLLVSKKKFESQVTRLLNRIKKAKKLRGVKEIYLPGERGNLLTKKNILSGEIEIEPNLYKNLKEVASKS